MIDPVKSSDQNPIALSDLETSSLLYGVLVPVSLLLQKVDARKTNSEFNEKMKREENEKTGGERWKWKLFVRNQDSQSHQSFNKILEPIVSLSSKHDSTSFWDGLHSILSLPFYRLQK